MLTTQELQNTFSQGRCILDGATGSNLRLAGMPKACSTEKWVLDNPDIFIALQRAYAQAGSDILYAPTFQAQPVALEKLDLDKETESFNAELVALSRKAAPECLIAGDLTTLAAFCDSWDPDQFDFLVENYRRQIRGLIDGGVDLLAAETLLYPQEAEAILTAAELECAGAVMVSFTMQSAGSLFSGQDAGPVLKQLQQYGAAAVGFNCVGADMMTPYLVSKLRRFTSLPLICKPNAGNPIIGEDGNAHYNLSPEEFADIILQCRDNGANVFGGCCGTTPEHIRTMVDRLRD